MGYRLDGSGSLSYQGVKPTTPPQMMIMDRRPTTRDYIDINIGTLWTIPDKSTNVYGGEMWLLVLKEQNVGTWVKVNGSAGVAGIAQINVLPPITTSGTYTPSADLLFAQVECVGGGGGGGGVGVVTGNGATGGSGGAGGYSKSLFTAAQIGASQVYVIGAGGTAGAAAYGAPGDGSSGGNTTFGTIVLMIAGGGIRGIGALSAGQMPTEGSAGGSASGGEINIAGQYGNTGSWNTGGSPEGYISAAGGSGMYGSGGYGVHSAGGSGGVPGKPGTGYGSGGSGAAAFDPVGPTAGAIGGVGAGGVIIITEYLS